MAVTSSKTSSGIRSANVDIGSPSRIRVGRTISPPAAMRSERSVSAYQSRSSAMTSRSAIVLHPLLQSSPLPIAQRAGGDDIRQPSRGRCVGYRQQVPPAFRASVELAPADSVLIRNDDKQRSRTEDQTGDFGSRDVVPGDVRLVVIVPKELGHILHVEIVARRMAMPYDKRTAHPPGSQCPSRPLSDHRVTAARNPRAIERAIPVSVGTQRSILEASEQGLYESVHFKEPPTSPFQGGNTGSNPVGGASLTSASNRAISSAGAAI